MKNKKIKSIGKDKALSAVKSWKNTLTNIPCFIIGNGPSLDDDLPKDKSDILDDYFTVGINRSFLRCDTMVLTFQDMSLWWTERKVLVKQKSIILCRNRADPENKFFHFLLLGGQYDLPKDGNPSALIGRGSSGPLAFQIAFYLGCSPIVLLGMDCRYRDGKTDFFGVNTMHREKSTLKNCKLGLEWIRDCNCGREVINCSDNKVFDHRRKLKEVLSSLPNLEAHDREYFKNRILNNKK